MPSYLISTVLSLSCSCIYHLYLDLFLSSNYLILIALIQKELLSVEHEKPGFAFRLFRTTAFLYLSKHHDTLRCLAPSLETTTCYWAVQLLRTENIRHTHTHINNSSNFKAYTIVKWSRCFFQNSLIQGLLILLVDLCSSKIVQTNQVVNALLARFCPCRLDAGKVKSS